MFVLIETSVKSNGLCGSYYALIIIERYNRNTIAFTANINKKLVLKTYKFRIVLTFVTLLNFTYMIRYYLPE